MKEMKLDSESDDQTAISFVPARWWQAVPFLRMNLNLVRGTDPLADRILARPWALSSLLEYAYMLDRFLRSNSYFIIISGERAGILWTVKWSEVFFIITLGLLPRYQQRGIGTQVIALAEEYARRHNCRALAAAVAPSNKPVLRLIAACGAKILGLATTKLMLSDYDLEPSFSKIKIEEIARSQAINCWRRWRLHEVEQVTGHEGVAVAAELLNFMSLPKGEYLTLSQDGQEVGFAWARKRESGLELGLFPRAALWSGSHTADLVAALGSHLGSPIHLLTLTQTHFETLAESPPFDFEREGKEERRFSFKPV